jgi:hypothetical protein
MVSLSTDGKRRRHVEPVHQVKEIVPNKLIQKLKPTPPRRSLY